MSNAGRLKCYKQCLQLSLETVDHLVNLIVSLTPLIKRKTKSLHLAYRLNVDDRLKNSSFANVCESNSFT